ncbi:hypothetical protein GUJ93_ZPchr0010g7448 [Zizania palustris]|uniref:Uncharacterized protein n=1 Tax=Zizania palustris TaxID=103762 RepID=A0A8J5WCI9_ZIZPA|nr:hypothetical protein GUJ93_ZPchr0010g7448 [Zizania palustris]
MEVGGVVHAGLRVPGLGEGAIAAAGCVLHPVRQSLARAILAAGRRSTLWLVVTLDPVAAAGKRINSCFIYPDPDVKPVTV